MATSRERASYTAELDLSDIGKGTYPYYMLKEIDEQPTVMRKLIQAYTDEAGQVVVDPAIIKAVQEADRIYILAAGTSYHAGFASKKMLEELTDTPVELGISSEWVMLCRFSARNHSLSLSASLVKQLIAVRFWLRLMKWEFQA